MKSEHGHTLAILVRERGTEPFISDATRTYTYEQFFSAALECAEVLVSQKLTKGDTVCLVVPNAIETLVLYMGALMAGLRIMLLDPEKGSEERTAILDQCEYVRAVTVPSIPLARSFRLPPLEFEKHHVSKIATALESIDDDAVFVITFTSGSTGVPKGVMHSFRNLCKTADAFRAEFDFSEKDTFYHHLPMTYMAGVLNSFILPLISGCRVVVGPRFSVREAPHFWELPMREKVTVLWTVPTVLSLLTKLDRGSESKSYARQVSLTVCVGTAPLNKIVRDEFESAYGVPLFESYGLSETLFVATQTPRRFSPHGSVGVLLPGARITFDADELMIDVPWIFRGYMLGKRQESPLSPFPSGDLGHLRDGILAITGRKKDIIIRGGINISPRKLEEFISERLKGDVVVMGFPHDVLGEKIVCFYTTPLSPDEKSALVNDIGEKLGAQYSVDEFSHCDVMSRNTNEKIDKLALAATYDNAR